MSFCLASGLAAAQAAPPGSRGNLPPPDRDAQRREQIREVLKQGRGGGAPSGGGSFLLVSPPPYQLTPQGRAELREQLRRERPDNLREQP